MTNIAFANKIAQLLQNAGVTVTSAQLQATAAQYLAIVTPDSLIPGGIWAIGQLLASISPTTQGLVFSGNYGTAGPLFTPSSSGAIAIDTITRQQYQYANGAWT